MLKRTRFNSCFCRNHDFYPFQFLRLPSIEIIFQINFHKVYTLWLSYPSLVSFGFASHLLNLMSLYLKKFFCELSLIHSSLRSPSPCSRPASPCYHSMLWFERPSHPHVFNVWFDRTRKRGLFFLLHPSVQFEPPCPCSRPAPPYYHPYVLHD